MGHINLSYQNFQVSLYFKVKMSSQMLLTFFLLLLFLVIKHFYLQVTDTPGILRRSDGKSFFLIYHLNNMDNFSLNAFTISYII